MSITILYTIIVSGLVGVVVILHVISILRHIDKTVSVASPSGTHFPSFNIVFVIPLLREKEKWPETGEFFKHQLEKYPQAQLLLITTERERIESKVHADQNTQMLIRNWVERQDRCFRERIYHTHFPSLNKNLAEQLNYGLSQLMSKWDEKRMNETFFAFYNADSQPGVAILDVFFKNHAKVNGLVYQQSSIFLANYEKLVKDNHFFGLANGIFQTLWTFTNEIPRLLASVRYPSWRLAHVVSHGLFIRADILTKVGLFPTDSPGEDLYLGFILRSFGISIHPLPYLEWSDTPSNFVSTMRQKYVWFWGPLGYFFYWKRVSVQFPKIFNNNLLGVMSMTLQGIFSALNWLLVSYLFMSLIVGSVNTHLWIGGIAFLAYCWIPSTILIWKINKHFPSRLKITISLIIAQVLFLPLVLITHSIPALLTLLNDLRFRIIGWKSFVRPKTEI
jgi:Glycosyl transferase family group 2